MSQIFWERMWLLIEHSLVTEIYQRHDRVPGRLINSPKIKSYSGG